MFHSHGALAACRYVLPLSRRPCTRSCIRKPRFRTGPVLFQAEALTSRKAGFGKDVETALLDLAHGFPQLSQTRAATPVLTDAVLSEQMRLIGTLAADPQQLANAMVVVAMRNSG